MNLDESPEGSSCNGQENGDGFNGSERPLKKARFAWQVKGKYHLKNDPAKLSTSESIDPDTAGPSGSGSNSSNSKNIDTEQDSKTLCGYSLNKNLDTLDSVVNEPDKSGLKQSKRNLSSRENPISKNFIPSAILAEEILSRNFFFQNYTDSKIVKPIDTEIPATESVDPEMAGSSGSESNSSNSIIDTEQYSKTISGYLLNKNLDTLDSVVNEPDISGLKPSKRNLSSRENPIRKTFTPSVVLAEEILNHTRNYFSQNNTDSKIVNPIDTQIGNSQVPISNYMLQSDDNCDEFEFGLMSMMTSQTYTEDQCIARWQAKQMAKGPLDNTINRILDYMKQNSLEEGNATFESFDVADIINDRPEVDSIENEGILMAISAHGLQNTSNSSSSSSSNSSSPSMSLDFKEICVPSIKSPALRISFSPIHSDDESDAEIQHELKCALDEVQWPYSDKLKTEDNETIPTPTFDGTSSLSFQNLYENLHNTDAASNDAAVDNDNHHDFLDAAVLFAIQSKGLTTFGTDYG